MTRILRNPIFIISFIALIVALIVGFDVTEWVRGGYGWRWQYELADLSRMIPLILAIGGYLLGAWWLIKRTNHEWLVLVWVMLGALVIAYTGLIVREDSGLFGMFARVASLATGQHWASVRIDWAGGEWQNWSEVMQQFGGHMTNVPPGAPMFYGALNGLFDGIPALSVPAQRALMPLQCNNYDLIDYTSGQWASIIFGLLMPFWSALTVLPMAVIIRRTTKLEPRYALLWYPLIPALVGFASSWSTLYPFISVSAFALLVVGLQRKNLLYILLTGIVCGVGTFINFALVPLGLLLGLYILIHEGILQRQQGWILRTVSSGVVLGVGVAIPWLIFYLLGGQTFFELLRTSFGFHMDLDRPYWFWVGMHLWDWLLWTGIIMALLSLAGLIQSFRQRAERPISGVTVALWLTMLILIFSGTARGETGRVWLFFSPFLLISALDGFDRLRTIRASDWLMLSGTQAVYLLVMVASISTMAHDFVPVPDLPVIDAPLNATDATFQMTDNSAQFHLTGWQGAQVDNQLILKLQWQGVTESLTPIWFGGVLVAPDGSSYAIEPWQPSFGEQRYPTTCWRNGVSIFDVRTIPLADNAFVGDWWLSLSAFGDDQQPEGRLKVITPVGEDIQIGLGPVVAEEK